MSPSYVTRDVHPVSSLRIASAKQVRDGHQSQSQSQALPLRATQLADTTPPSTFNLSYSILRGDIQAAEGTSPADHTSALNR